MTILPILFNTQMVKAIMEGRKTVTRRIINPQPQEKLIFVWGGSDAGYWKYSKETAKKWRGEEYPLVVDPTAEMMLQRKWKPPCHADNLLYVRETWKQATSCPSGGGYDIRDHILFKADEPQDTTGMMVEDRWHPSIHMPREAARLFLKVKMVSCQRLNDMQEEDAIEEGFPDSPAGTDSPLERFSVLWDKTLKREQRDEFGWYANPWVWVIRFEKIEKPEWLA